jgi:hypothetical protein
LWYLTVCCSVYNSGGVAIVKECACLIIQLLQGVCMLLLSSCAIFVAGG